METIYNSYHNTSIRTRTSREDRELINYLVATGLATRAQKTLRRRIKRALCPSADCTCGDSWGIR